MPAYHSKFNELEGVRSIGGVSILPLKALNSKGVATHADENEKDVVDETLEYFRANMLFTTFDIQGDADRLLIYLTSFAAQCIKAVAKEKIATKEDGAKFLHGLATKRFPLPGDSNFLPGLGHFFGKHNIPTQCTSARCCAVFFVGANLLFVFLRHSSSTLFFFRARKKKEKPSSKSNADFLKQYFQQLRQELTARLCERIFNEDGTPNKWWMAYSKRNFMGQKDSKKK